MNVMTESPFNTDEARWQAVIRRDPQADGHFYLGVKTTGIYCRPTCSSRKPNRVNVQFFATGDEAIQAGFRPCKRCRPQSDNCLLYTSPSPRD